MAWKMDFFPFQGGILGGEGEVHAILDVYDERDYGSSMCTLI